MKKFGLILIIFLMITFGLSATPAASSDLYMSTEVVGFSEIRVADGTLALPDSKSGFESLVIMGSEESPIVFYSQGVGGADGSYPLGIFVMSNTPGTYSVTSTAMPLKNSGGYIMPYSVKIGDEASITVNDNAGSPLTIIDEFKVEDGLTFGKSDVINVSILAVDFEAGQAGTYSSVWTINLITQ